MRKQTVINKTTNETCSGCGRELQDVEETRTRRNVMIERKIWRECPKFPRNGFMNMMPPWRFCTSKSIELPFMGRQYQ